MLKKAFIAAIAAAVLPLLAAPALAQDKSSDHHYSGGANSNVPHHIGKRSKSNTAGSKKTPSQAGQHHYQGGPQAIHHIGEMPKAAGEATTEPRKAKRKKKKSS